MADVKEAIDEVVNKAEEAPDRLNQVIAVLVAVLATVMALFSIKGGNIGQAMAQAQARSVNAWAYFQAKSTKQAFAEGILEQLLVARARRSTLSSDEASHLEQTIAHYREQIERYESEKAEIKAQAEGFEQEYRDLNFHDDQFDIAEAGLTVAMALLGIAALVRRGWLVWFALIFAGVGLASGVSGFVGASFHLDFLANLLG